VQAGQLVRLQRELPHIGDARPPRVPDPIISTGVSGQAPGPREQRSRDPAVSTGCPVLTSTFCRRLCPRRFNLCVLLACRRVAVFWWRREILNSTLTSSGRVSGAARSAQHRDRRCARACGRCATGVRCPWRRAGFYAGECGGARATALDRLRLCGEDGHFTATWSSPSGMNCTAFAAGLAIRVGGDLGSSTKSASAGSGHAVDKPARERDARSSRL
jgi:hypothetical protein